MSAGKWLRDLSHLPLSLLASVAGWLLIAPLSALVPKRRDWITVIGRQDGRFLDNAKYFFLLARQAAPDLRIMFSTERRDVCELLSVGRLGLLYPTLPGIWFMLRCGTVVVDEAAWFRRMRFFLLIRARVVQLWHGIGCKWIELGLWRHETGHYMWISHPWAVRARLLAYHLTGRRMRYAAVATTSRFYRDHVFESSFLARHFPIIGYPRNDFALSLHGKFHELAWSNVDADIRGRLEAWQRSGRRVVLVTPTFRGSGAAPMQLDFAILRAIDEFADTNGTEFIFKFHPSERNADHIGGRHFHVCSRESDIYPVLPHAAALVTDFSSISMDFLLVDKPILFLVPEGDDYVEKDRQLQFDPHTMMPGPLLPDWPSLLTALLAEWTCDGYLEERAALRRKAFDAHPQSEAVPKLIAFMREQGWVSPAVNKDNLRPRVSQPPTNPR